MISPSLLGFIPWKINLMCSMSSYVSKSTLNAYWMLRPFTSTIIGVESITNSTNFFQEISIKQQVSCPYTHQQNGTDERKHRHIVDMGLSLPAQSCVPLKFWDEAFSSTCFLINRLPSHVINFDTLLERLLGSKPDYSMLKTFHCAR